MESKFNYKNFSIVIPIYNEEEILEESFNAIFALCKKMSLDFEIIFSENGSTDKTKKIAEELRRDTRMHQYQGVQDPHVEIKAFAELYNSDNEAIGAADILISPTATNNPGPQIYEVKKEQADIDAVRQIFGYMKARGIKDGIIAAQTLASKAENLMKEYNNNHDVNITFWDYTQLAIFN